jgi:hypothetical protein
LKLDDRVKIIETIVEGDETLQMPKHALKEIISLLKDYNTVLRTTRDLIDMNHKSILKIQILIMLETKEDRVLEQVKKMLNTDTPHCNS